MLVTKTLPPRALLRELLRYNPTTGELWWRRRPRRMFVNDRAYAVWNVRYAYKSAGYFKKHGYSYVAVARSKHLTHRVIWLMHHGEPVPKRIDHADGNSRNNAIANLRAATQTQNMANAKVSKRSTTGIKGVIPAGDKFSARIVVNKKARSLGTFDTVEEAAAAYKEAAIRLRGEFARWD